MESVRTACPLDCPDSCALSVTVQDGRVVEVGPDLLNPHTRAFICAKVRKFPERLYGDLRIGEPMVRSGRKGAGDFKAVSWERALELLVRKVGEVKAEFGGEAILPLSYGGSNGVLSQDTTDARFFEAIGASRLARTVCAAPTGAVARAMYGKMIGVGADDYGAGELIILWGVNPEVSGIHWVPIIRRAQKRGARLVVIDPRKTRLAAKADLHLAVRPGSDLVVALSLIHRLFEDGHADLDFLEASTTGWQELRRRAAEWTLAKAAEIAGVRAEDLELLLDWYARSSPAVIRCGWGLERNRNGGSAVAAVLALPAVAGKFGVRGGGYTLSNSGVWKFPPFVREPAGPSRRVINMNRVGRALLGAEPPVKLLFVYNNNPWATLPDQNRVRRGLEREDLFTVVFDAVRTDTARFADLLLPATTFLEHDDLVRGYGTPTLKWVQPAISPLFEARSNFEVFAELCRRMGLAEYPQNAKEAGDQMVGAMTDGPRLVDEMERLGYAAPDTGLSPVQFKDVFPGTEEGKVHLCPPALDEEAPEGLYAFRTAGDETAYPLSLISPATKRTINSTMGELWRRQVSVQIHPDDARSRGVKAGDAVSVYNDLGSVECEAEVSGLVRRGTAVLPKGLWSHHTLNESTSNALVPDRLTDIGAGACFNDARVEIRLLDRTPTEVTELTQRVTEKR